MERIEGGLQASCRSVQIWQCKRIASSRVCHPSRRHPERERVATLRNDAEFTPPL